MKANLSILASNRIVSATPATPEPSRLYLSTAVLMTAIVIAGFWSPYFAPLLQGTAAFPWVIHIHSAVFLGWMTLLFLQVLFVYQGQIQRHRTLGNIGTAYGLVVFVMGVIVAVAAPILHVKNGEWQMDRAAGFFLIGLRAIVVFGSFFLAAIAFKQRPEIHKRLILLATVALLFAPVGRMINPVQSPPLFLAVWLSPVLITMGRDAVTVRRVHPTFLIGLAVLLVGFTPVVFSESEGYLNVGRSLLRIFL